MASSIEQEKDLSELSLDELKASTLESTKTYLNASRLRVHSTRETTSEERLPSRYVRPLTQRDRLALR